HAARLRDDHDQAQAAADHRQEVQSDVPPVVTEDVQGRVAELLADVRDRAERPEGRIEDRQQVRLDHLSRLPGLAPARPWRRRGARRRITAPGPGPPRPEHSLPSPAPPPMTIRSQPARLTLLTFVLAAVSMSSAHEPTRLPI